MGTYDIQFALDWLSWRLQAQRRNYSQEYLDKMAIKKLQEASVSPHAAEEARQLAATAMAETAQIPKLGTADRACNALCARIVKASTEDDFEKMLAVNPQKIVPWRKLWNRVRADRIRQIPF